MSGTSIIRGKRQRAKATTDETDWSRVRSVTDGEIERAVAEDPDTFVPDARWMRQARLVAPGAKEMVTLRLDPDVLAWFRQAGRGYQTRINTVLKAFVSAQTRQRKDVR